MKSSAPTRQRCNAGEGVLFGCGSSAVVLEHPIQFTVTTCYLRWVFFILHTISAIAHIADMHWYSLRIFIDVLFISSCGKSIVASTRGCFPTVAMLAHDRQLFVRRTRWKRGPCASFHDLLSSVIVDHHTFFMCSISRAMPQMQLTQRVG